MPINPNIALGIQQPQPVNMLGQVGQMIALKAATEEMRGNEEMRNLFSGGVNFDDPEFQKRGYMANPKAFQELLGKRATTQKTEIEALGKEITLRRDALANVDTPEDYLKWHEANHTGRLGTFFKSAGISPSRESIMAKLSQPGGLDKLKRESALGATKLQQELMQTERSVQVANIGASATMRGQDLLENRERDKMAREKAEREAIQNALTGRSAPAPTAAVTSPIVSNGGGGGSSGGGSGQNSSIFVNPASSNVLADQVLPTTAPATSVNGLGLNAPAAQTLQQISALIRTGSPKAVQVADALIKEYNLLNPVQKVERDANGALRIINERTGVSSVVTGQDGKPLPGGIAPVWNEKAQVYMTPPTPENPAGKITEVPELRQIAKKRSATETLDIAGFNKNTGTNEISDFIKQSTSGLAENALAKTAGALFGKGTPGAEAIAKLETRANELTLGLAPNGSLGAGFSNDDRTFMLAKLGDVANANKPMNVRLAAWEDVMSRAARNAGVEYKKSTSSGGGGSASGGAKTVTRTGTINGRKVVQYSDGSTAYAD
jgi:hypothetical protein